MSVGGTTNGDIRVSAVAFVRRAADVPGGYEVLTVRKQGTELHQYPGGKPEPGEDAVSAAVREVAEETGIAVAASCLTFVGTFTAAAANERGHSVTADIFLHEGAPGEVVDPVVAAEIADARWLPLGTTTHTPDDPAHRLAPLMFTTFPQLADALTFSKHNLGRPGAWEHACLDWLGDAADRGGVPVAGVVGTGGASGEDLLLQRVGQVTPTPAHAEEFGRRLAVTHACGAPSFGAGPAGWDGPGYQGPNDNLLELPLTPHDRWGAFYAEVVLGPLERRVPGGIPGTAQLLDRLTAGDFDDTRPPARLHGDLWSGNVLWGHDGAVLIDPSAHGGHPLTDLGFLTMFGAPHLERVLSAYAEAAGLDADWRDLLELHRLQVLYLHAAVFGGGYVGEAAAGVHRALTL